MLVQILQKNIINPDENTSIYDYLGGGTGHCLYLKPIDEQEIINTVKACT